MEFGANKTPVDLRQSNRGKKIVGRFKGKLVKMIADMGADFDDFSVPPKIRQILLHCVMN